VEYSVKRVKHCFTRFTEVVHAIFQGFQCTCFTETNTIAILQAMRKTETEGVAPQFVDRWSSREYDGTLLTQEQINILLEAARWTPSSYNEQPWKFFYPKTDNQRKKFLNLLFDGNQEWAKNTGTLFFIAAKRTLSETGEQNRHYAFDTGAAWMALALQAHLVGLSAHAMGGFDEGRAYDELSIDRKEYEIFAAIAVGKPTQEAGKTEERTPRKPIAGIADSNA